MENPFSLPVATAQLDTQRQKLRAMATELEVEFLSEMLGYLQPDQSSESFGGGVGEEQFASLLRREQAKAMAKNGGIGLAEILFESMVKAQNGESHV